MYKRKLFFDKVYRSGKIGVSGIDWVGLDCVWIITHQLFLEKYWCLYYLNVKEMSVKSLQLKKDSIRTCLSVNWHVPARIFHKFQNVLNTIFFITLHFFLYRNADKIYTCWLVSSSFTRPVYQRHYNGS